MLVFYIFSRTELLELKLDRINLTKLENDIPFSWILKRRVETLARLLSTKTIPTGDCRYKSYFLNGFANYKGDQFRLLSRKQEAIKETRHHTLYIDIYIHWATVKGYDDILTHTNTPTHTLYIYIYICVCVCVCVYIYIYIATY